MSRRATLELVVTRSGHHAVFDGQTGEIMHPQGPRQEAALLYVQPARIAARLAEPRPGPLVVLDVGLGAGSNAVAALAVALEAGPAALHVVSFDRSADALSLVCASEHAEAFGFTPPLRAAAAALLSFRRAEVGAASWRLVVGELPATLREESPRSADVVFWDPYSPAVNGEMWSLAAFRAAAAVCREGATLHTYSRATRVRAALFLAGFAVGVGPAVGAKEETTIACFGADAVARLERPLDRRWLTRLVRSSAPLPVDAPGHAMDELHALPQLAR